MIRNILRQLGGEPAYAADIAGKIANGDLTVQVQTRDGDTTSLLAAMKEMNDKLVAIVTDVRGSLGTGRLRRQADLGRQQQPLPAHPGTGVGAGRDRFLHGRDDLDREAERRQHPPGQPTGRQHPHPGPGRRRSGDQGGGCHGADQRLLEENRRHHRRHRRDRVPDQPAGAQRRGRSRPRRRTGPRLRRGGDRGP